MITESLSHLFDRELARLKSEIASFRREENIWKTVNGVINPSGNLCLHICGNLQHFIGATYGATGYERDRDKEFSARNIPRSKLLKEVDATEKVVKTTITQLTRETLKEPFPYDFLGPVSTEEAMIHFYGHLQWHLGQLNYLRRILES